MSDDLTLKEAAQHFNVSMQTIRRWIKDGKLQAELRDSPYGQQYYIPAYQVRTAAEIQDVVKVDRTVDMASLAQVMEGYLSERERALFLALESMQTEIRESAQRGEQTRQEMMREIAATKAENERLHKELGERIERQAEEQERRLAERMEQRDKALMETLRALNKRAEQEQQQKKRRWWQR